jgi:hypothetical protein
MIFAKVALQIDQNFICVFTRSVIDRGCVLFRLGGNAACARKRFLVYFAFADAVVNSACASRAILSACACACSGWWSAS